MKLEDLLPESVAQAFEANLGQQMADAIAVDMALKANALREAGEEPNMLRLLESGAMSQLTKDAGERVVGVSMFTKYKVNQVLLEGAEAAATPAEIAKALQTDKGGAFSRARARTIARTESAIIGNQNSLVAIAGTGAFSSVRVMDNEGPNSCQLCKDANGQVWSMEDAFANPVQHPNCVRAFAPSSDKPNGKPQTGAGGPVSDADDAFDGGTLGGGTEIPTTGGALGNFDGSEAERARAAEAYLRDAVQWPDDFPGRPPAQGETHLLGGQAGQAHFRAWADSLPRHHRMALNEWTGMSYETVRSAIKGMLGGRITSVEQTSYPGFMTNFRQAFERAPRGKGTVYRGIRNVDKTVVEQWIAGGADIDFAIPASTSRLKKQGERFIKQGSPRPGGVHVMLKIETDQGVDISSLSEFPEEAEALLWDERRYVTEFTGITEIEANGETREVYNFTATSASSRLASR